MKDIDPSIPANMSLESSERPARKVQRKWVIAGLLILIALVGSGTAMVAQVPPSELLPDSIGGPVLRSAAMKGDPAAAYEVGSRFLEGRGVAVNFEEAAKWLGRAAQAGVVPAAFKIGSLYEKGLGVKKDLDIARRYYTLAAGHGNAAAMYNLAVLDATPGNSQNFESAAQWFRKAADHGVADSQYNLGVLYLHGSRGVEQNLVESYKWFSLAAAQGDHAAAARRDDVATRLDPTSLAAAKLETQSFTVERQPDDAVTVVAPVGGWDSASNQTLDHSDIAIDQGSGGRAVLFEEDVNNPQERKQFVGSLVCRLELIKGTDDRASDAVMHADVEIPDRKFKMTLSFPRSNGPSAPAGHVDLAFNVPPDFPGGGVDAVLGILIKSSEQKRGAPLAGFPVKATDGSFRLDFSKLDAADRARNVKLMNENSWFDIPLVYANGHRAFVVIDGRGNSCERAANDASIALGESQSAENQSSITPGDQASESQSDISENKTADESQEQSRHSPKDQSRFTPEGQATESQSGGSENKTADELQEQSRHSPKDQSRFTQGDQASSGRAVLAENGLSDPKAFQQFAGVVDWRIEPVRASDSQPADIAVRADIEIPDRKLKMTMLFQRNTDPALPASHTLELTFKLPPDFQGGGVDRVVGFTMKSGEHVAGRPLEGSIVKVTGGDFLAALSNTNQARANNFQLLKKRPWFDIILVYANQRQAILAIGKGASGERAFNDAFAAWGE